MTKTSSSRRISSAMASRSASRTVIVTISVPAGTAGSAATSAFGWAGTLSEATEVGSFSEARALPPASLAAAGVSASALAGAGFCVSMASALSPSCRRTAIGVLTFTASVPAGISSLPITPSSTASTSIVALSVSISAITSPAVTLSPSFFSHLESVPSSIVGERAGIRICTGISIVLPVDQSRISV